MLTDASLGDDMDKHLLRSLLAAAVYLLAASASAADFNYDWLSAGALNVYPGGGITERGWFLDGSYAVAPQFTVEGDFDRASLNGCPALVAPQGQVLFIYCVKQASSDEDYRLGGGWHMPVTDDADLLVDAYYAHDQFHQGSTDFLVILQPPPPGFGCATGTTTVPGGCDFGTTQDRSGGGYLVAARLPLGRQPPQAGRAESAPVTEATRS